MVTIVVPCLQGYCFASIFSSANLNYVEIPLSLFVSSPLALINFHSLILISKSVYQFVNTACTAVFFIIWYDCHLVLVHFNFTSFFWNVFSYKINSKKHLLCISPINICIGFFFQVSSHPNYLSFYNSQFCLKSEVCTYMLIVSGVTMR